MNADRPDAGFTLVELLVALTLLALLGTLMLGGFQFGARSWERVAEVSGHRDRVALTQSFLRRRLGDLSAPAGLYRDADTAALPLEGEAHAMRFLSEWQAGPAVSGLYLFRLWHDAERAEVRLGWQQVSGSATGTGGEAAQGERVLLEAVSGLDIGYFGARPDTPQGGWSDRWESGDGALSLVTLKLAFTDPQRMWPPFAVAPGM